MARIGIVPGKPFDWNKLGRRHSTRDLARRHRGRTQRHEGRLEDPRVNQGERLARQPRARLGKLRHELLAAGCRRLLGVGRGAPAGRHLLRRRRRREAQQLHDHVPGEPDAAGERGVGHRHVQHKTPSGEQSDQPLCDRAALGTGELQLGRVAHGLRAEQGTQRRQPATELAPGSRRRIHRLSCTSTGRKSRY